MSAVDVAVMEAEPLERLAQRANLAHAHFKDAVSQALPHAIEAGEALLAAKAQVAHGNWVEWIAANFDSSERTAQLYMRMAREIPKLDDETATAVADLSLREAARAIATRTTLCSSSGNAEWYTPKAIADAAVQVLGEVDLDPSWHPESPVQANRTFTMDDDGLAQLWGGRVYLKPPYGREIDDWVEKLVEGHVSGEITEAIALVPARVDTEWFRRLDAYPRCFVSGRLTFANATNPAPFPSAIVYLGDNLARFVEVFGPVGGIFVRLAAEARP